eukprot:COSAG06_NODE_60854_length_268_cov_1.076471_1_plen_35_part_01
MPLLVTRRKRESAKKHLGWKRVRLLTGIDASHGIE